MVGEGLSRGCQHVHGRDRAEEGVWAPDFQDGSSALHSHTEGLPRGGVCPVALHAGSVGRLARDLLCVCGGRGFPRDTEARVDQAAGRADPCRACYHMS